MPRKKPVRKAQIATREAEDPPAASGLGIFGAGTGTGLATKGSADAGPQQEARAVWGLAYAVAIVRGLYAENATHAAEHAMRAFQRRFPDAT